MGFLIENVDETSGGESEENACMWKLIFILVMTENNHEAWSL